MVKKLNYAEYNKRILSDVNEFDNNSFNFDISKISNIFYKR